MGEDEQAVPLQNYCGIPERTRQSIGPMDTPVTEDRGEYSINIAAFKYAHLSGDKGFDGERKSRKLSLVLLFDYSIQYHPMRHV